MLVVPNVHKQLSYQISRATFRRPTIIPMKRNALYRLRVAVMLFYTTEKVT